MNSYLTRSWFLLLAGVSGDVRQLPTGVADDDLELLGFLFVFQDGFFV